MKKLVAALVVSAAFLAGMQAKARLGRNESSVWDRGKFERAMFRYFDEREAAGKGRFLIDKLMQF